MNRKDCSRLIRAVGGGRSCALLWRHLRCKKYVQPLLHIGTLQPGQPGRTSSPRHAGMAGGGSHLWADEVEEEDAAKGIPPPEKFMPAPEWRGSAGRPAEPRAFRHQQGPDAPVSPTTVRLQRAAKIISLPGRQDTCLNLLTVLAASVIQLGLIGHVDRTFVEYRQAASADSHDGLQLPSGLPARVSQPSRRGATYLAHVCRASPCPPGNSGARGHAGQVSRAIRAPGPIKQSPAAASSATTQGMGPEGRYDMPSGWHDDMSVARGTARSRLDMQHGFVRHIVRRRRRRPRQQQAPVLQSLPAAVILQLSVDLAARQLANSCSSSSASGGQAF